MSAQQFDPNLARKEWGWRWFGSRYGISLLLTRGRWMGLSLERHPGGIVILNFGCGELWLRVPR